MAGYLFIRREEDRCLLIDAGKVWSVWRFGCVRDVLGRRNQPVRVYAACSNEVVQFVDSLTFQSECVNFRVQASLETLKRQAMTSARVGQRFAPHVNSSEAKNQKIPTNNSASGVTRWSHIADPAKAL
jgi:hypothetical protein